MSCPYTQNRTTPTPVPLSSGCESGSSDNQPILAPRHPPRRNVVLTIRTDPTSHTRLQRLVLPVLVDQRACTPAGITDAPECTYDTRKGRNALVAVQLSPRAGAGGLASTGEWERGGDRDSIAESRKNPVHPPLKGLHRRRTNNGAWKRIPHVTHANRREVPKR